MKIYLLKGISYYEGEEIIRACTRKEPLIAFIENMVGYKKMDYTLDACLVSVKRDREVAISEELPIDYHYYDALVVRELEVEEFDAVNDVIK